LTKQKNPIKYKNMTYNKREKQAMDFMAEYFSKENWIKLDPIEWLKIRGCGIKMITKLQCDGLCASYGEGSLKIEKEKAATLDCISFDWGYYICMLENYLDV